jgi:dimethylaniline monooxygenase (N-oxide forming)
MITSRTEKKLDKKIDHEKYCLKPKHHLFSAHPTLNDELPNRIISGGVIVKANVAEFTETGAIFEDGTTIDNLDAVILATGYSFGFPFIDKSVIEVKANKVDLYKYMFPPDLQKHTMAIIGCFQPLGAIMPLSEMQCRLATRVFKVNFGILIDLDRFARKKFEH